MESVSPKPAPLPFPASVPSTFQLLVPVCASSRMNAVLVVNVSVAVEGLDAMA
jgi:hypothetical protein